MSSYWKINWRIFEAIISGPLYAGIILIIPFGMLTALSVVMDPSFVIYEFLPEELLFIPWFILSIFISLGNIRVSNICGSESGKKRIITISNTNIEKYMKRSINNVSENIAQDIYICIDKMKSKQIKSLTNRIREYGIDIVVEDTSNQIISIAVSSSSRGIGDVKGLNIIVELLVSFEPPFFPWNRIKYNGNIELKMQIEESIEDFLKKMQFNYLIESA
jgi:hypothetical protein